MNENLILETRLLLCHYLRDLAKEKGLTHQMIADVTGFKSNNVSRMLSGMYPPTLDNFIKLAHAINTYIFIIDKNADDDIVLLMRNRWNNPPISEN